MKKIRTALDILHKQGFEAFLKKLNDFFEEQLRRIYFLFWKKSIIKKLKSISVNTTEDLQKILKNEFLGIFNPQQVTSEFKRLLEIVVEKKPKIIMEIGTANGGSLFSWCKIAPKDAVIISIDLPGGSFGGGYQEWKIPFYKALPKEGQKLHLVRANSHKMETVEEARKILNGQTVDFLFIDGDHTYEGVKKDFDLYSPLVRQGGIVAFHDVAIHPKESECFVHVFWLEIKNKYKDKTEEIIENKNQNWAGIGIVYF